MSDLNLEKEMKVFTDGASRGNPGPAAVGVVFYDMKGECIGEYKEALGSQTNNYAEYMAVIRALEICKEKSVEKLDFYCDSQLLVKQMLGEYKVKSPQIIPLFERAKELTSYFKKVGYHHVRREQNKEADALANRALDSL